MTKKRILCVEDHQDTCALISTALEEYEVISAYSIEDALRLATLESFQLYLLDYHLPDGTGLELTLLIRQFDFETPILFVTGTSSMTEQQALKIGAQGLLRKGTDSFIKDIHAKVKQLLEE